MNRESSPEATVREIRRKTRRKYSAEEKIRVMLESLKGEESARRQVVGATSGPTQETAQLAGLAHWQRLSVPKIPSAAASPA